MRYLGDIAEDATISFCWSTVDGYGASITRSTNGTIKVRRHDDGTDCTGTSVTDTEDTPDTGLHECKIATADNANFTPSNDYTIWLDGAVVDGHTVNAVLATFSIENRVGNITKINGNATRATELALIAQYLIAADCTTLATHIQDGSILARIATDDGDISAWVSNTDSLEAIGAYAYGNNVLLTDGIWGSPALQIILSSIDTIVGHATYGNSAIKTLIDTAQTDLDTITGTDGVLVSTVGVTAINATVDTALSDIGLNHLLAASVAGTDVTDNSIFAKLVSGSATADWDTFNNVTDALQPIRDRGDAAWLTGSSAGSGATTFTYTLTSTVGGTAIADADIWITTDAAGAVVVASGRTDQNGQIVAYLDAGTIYVWRQKSGYDFTNPDTEVVA